MTNGEARRWRYMLIMLVIGVLAAMSIAVVVSVSVSRNAITESKARDREASAAARRASCLLIETIVDAYESEPPATPTGERVVKAWRYVAVAFGCEGD